MINTIIDMLCILFVCVTVTDRFNFWQNLGGEFHRMLLGNKKEVRLPYILTCSQCQSFWICLLYIILTGHVTIVYVALCVAVAGLNQIMFQLLNLLEAIIINIFKKMA